MALSIGIELDSSAIRVAVLGRSGSKHASSTRTLKLIEAREVPCDTSHRETLAQALSQLRRTIRIAQPVIMGVPSTSAILTTVRPLIVTPRRAALAIQFELQQLLPFALTDDAWHHQAFPSSSTEVMVAAMRRTLLEERVAACRNAGVAIRGVTINPVAVFNVWRAQASRMAPATTDTLLHIMNGQMAEWMTWRSGLFQVIPVSGSTPESCYQELAMSWEALGGQPSAVSNPVGLVGSSTEFPHWSEMAQRLRLHVVPLDLGPMVANGSMRVEHLERFAVAMGLALQGLGSVSVPLNLLAHLHDKERARRMRRTLVAASGVCATLAVGLGLSGTRDLYHRRVDALRLVEDQEQVYRTLRPDVRTLLQRQQRTQRRVEQLERMRLDATVVTQLLAQLIQALPDTVWLTKLECAKGGTMDAVLEGRAKSFQDVTQLIERLKSVAGVTNVKPLSTKVMPDEQGGKELIAFAVQVQGATP